MEVSPWLHHLAAEDEWVDSPTWKTCPIRGTPRPTPPSEIFDQWPSSTKTKRFWRNVFIDNVNFVSPDTSKPMQTIYWLPPPYRPTTAHTFSTVFQPPSSTRAAGPLMRPAPLSLNVSSSSPSLSFHSSGVHTTLAPDSHDSGWEGRAHTHMGIYKGEVDASGAPDGFGFLIVFASHDECFPHCDGPASINGEVLTDMLMDTQYRVTTFVGDFTSPYSADKVYACSDSDDHLEAVAGFMLPNFGGGTHLSRGRTLRRPRCSAGPQSFSSWRSPRYATRQRHGLYRYRMLPGHRWGGLYGCGLMLQLNENHCFRVSYGQFGSGGTKRSYLKVTNPSIRVWVQKKLPMNEPYDACTIHHPQFPHTFPKHEGLKDDEPGMLSHRQQKAMHACRGSLAVDEMVEGVSDLTEMVVSNARRCGSGGARITWIVLRCVQTQRLSDVNEPTPPSTKNEIEEWRMTYGRGGQVMGLVTYCDILMHRGPKAAESFVTSLESQFGVSLSECMWDLRNSSLVGLSMRSSAEIQARQAERAQSAHPRSEASGEGHSEAQTQDTNRCDSDISKRGASPSAIDTSCPTESADVLMGLTLGALLQQTKHNRRQRLANLQCASPQALTYIACAAALAAPKDKTTTGDSPHVEDLNLQRGDNCHDWSNPFFNNSSYWRRIGICPNAVYLNSISASLGITHGTSADHALRLHRREVQGRIRNGAVGSGWGGLSVTFQYGHHPYRDNSYKGVTDYWRKQTMKWTTSYRYGNEAADTQTCSLPPLRRPSASTDTGGSSVTDDHSTNEVPAPDMTDGANSGVSLFKEGEDFGVPLLTSLTVPGASRVHPEPPPLLHLAAVIGNAQVLTEAINLAHTYLLLFGGGPFLAADEASDLMSQLCSLSCDEIKTKRNSHASNTVSCEKKHIPHRYYDHVAVDHLESPDEMGLGEGEVINSFVDVFPFKYCFLPPDLVWASNQTPITEEELEQIGHHLHMGRLPIPASSVFNGRGQLNVDLSLATRGQMTGILAMDSRNLRFVFPRAEDETAGTHVVTPAHCAAIMGNMKLLSTIMYSVAMHGLIEYGIGDPPLRECLKSRGVETRSEAYKQVLSELVSKRGALVRRLSVSGADDSGDNGDEDELGPPCEISPEATKLIRRRSSGGDLYFEVFTTNPSAAEEFIGKCL
eukprot:GHVN01051837.1.p1 GENE.GHVN01051837.1~~GHVN01051837.1.p1  ORF type:complete len:1160 (+),score=149.71 GHVN01051837.1:58-3537(+)